MPSRHFYTMGLFKTECKENKIIKTNVYNSDTEPESQGSASDTEKQPVGDSSESGRKYKSSSGSRLSRQQKRFGASRKRSSSHKRVSSNADLLAIKGTEQLRPIYKPESQGSASDAEKQPICDSSESGRKSKCSSGSRLSRRRKKGGASRARSSNRSSRHKRVLSNADPFANKGTEKLGPDMMILVDAFHLDKNTQVLLAYYDARTLEDFCCMTQVDFDELKLSAERMNRALPPLQIRKVQTLREWVQGLAKNADNKPLRELNMPERLDRANLIPKDWKRKFKDALPDLKHALKERGEKNSISTNLLTHPYTALMWMFCGQEVP
jgi:hypothetical protein